MSVEQSKKRILKPEDLIGIVDTSLVTPTQEETADVDAFVKSGKIEIVGSKVFLHDAEMAKFSANGIYEINLNGGFVVIEPPVGSFIDPITTPVNLGPLAYLRQLAGWSPTSA